VEKFAGFGFCKAHAATYAEISWRIAWLKAHYPAEYLAAMCSAGAGFYHVSAYVEEAKRWTDDGHAGIEVRLPSVNHSHLEYSTDASDQDASSRARFIGEGLPHTCSTSSSRSIRIGLMQVRGLRSETISTILREREEHGPFHSLEDFLSRVPTDRDEIETLIKCGAFDELPGAPASNNGHLTRPELLWRLNLLPRPTLRGAGPPSRSCTADILPASSLFPHSAPPPSPAALPIPLPNYTPELRLRYEQELLEVCVSGHPLDLVPRNGENWSNELVSTSHNKNRRFTLLGWLITFRHVGTKDFRNMMFCTFEDQRGTFEAVLFPEAYERYGSLVFETRTMRVSGRIEQEGHLNCDKLEPVRP